MQLTKRIPARTKTVRFNWCNLKFTEMNEKFRSIRAKMQYKLDKCFWCRRPFVNGEMMALAQPRTGLNKVLCQSCADTLLDSDQPNR